MQGLGFRARGSKYPIIRISISNTCSALFGTCSEFEGPLIAV